MVKKHYKIEIQCGTGAWCLHTFEPSPQLWDLSAIFAHPLTVARFISIHQEIPVHDLLKGQNFQISDN